MKSTGATYKKYSSAGVDWASWFLGIGLGLTLATALMVDGVDAQKWIGRAELAGYSFWTINRHDGTAWSYGSNKGY
ncbi:hypothetical protein A1sIIA65_00305 [Candidatus Planktophila dulcis]|uniref:hypothetical protein n=1 Tax=Candidatus Planktophila dulcis TaxID=1884914 RepID=UPI000BACAC1E|nr:hypothetical protein [Candidatus Planktophila dulcis]ASY20724.1 hypothetical protein A1sIIA65_00305 [Candidatus Planktophila dulcis]